jgi:AbrB family looped-hinge helix DNA binding protein
MSSIALSPKFQIVIPKEIRRALNLQVNQRLEVRAVNDRVELIPILPMKSARGMFPGMNSDVPNDPESPSWPGGCEPAPNAFWTKLETKAK